jgi:signal transduction histidine kinase
VSVVFVRQILLVRLDEEINDVLEQEHREFRQLVGGNNPETGQPFGSDLRAIFDVFFARNVPDEGEELLAIVDGRPYLSKRAHDARPLERAPALISRLAALEETERREVTFAGEQARYLAVPVRIDGRVQGVFVVANFPGFERAEIDGVIRVVIAVAGGVMVIALLLAWAVAGRIVRPLRVLTATAGSIGQSEDLSRRLHVRGRDEVAELARRFNEMLDRLEEAFATQRAFVDDAGHELRTPLTIIRGHLELLEEGKQEERAETIALVMDELDRMSRMVNDMLMLAKANQPDFLHPEPVEIEALTREIYSKCSALGDRAWTLQRTGRGRVVADRQRLTQAVIQLADNAVGHTEEGQAISIGSALRDGEARFWVTDTGPGIVPKDRGRIFERFARGSAGKRIGDGAGLGLAIVKAIAEAHQGRVELKSGPGAGATFVISIPVLRAGGGDTERPRMARARR